MPAGAIPQRIHKHGESLCIVLNRYIREQLPWRKGDYVGLRVVGEKIIVERIALEKISVLRTGEAQTQDALPYGE